MNKEIERKRLLRHIGALCNGSITTRYISLYIDISANKEEISKRLSELHGDGFKMKGEDAVATLENVLSKDNTAIITPETYPMVFPDTESHVWNKPDALTQAHKLSEEMEKTITEFMGTICNNDYDNGVIAGYKIAISQFKNRFQHLLK